MTHPPARRPGRPAAATRDAVLAAARETFRAGERVDAQSVANTLGISRTTIFRWFGPRTALMGEVLAAEFRELLAGAERAVARGAGSAGAERIVAVASTAADRLSRHEPFATYLRAERLKALAVITASNGKVQPAAIAGTRALLERVCAEDDYRPRLPLDVLAFTVVRLVDAFLYIQYENDDVAVGAELTNLRAVLTALLAP